MTDRMTEYRADQLASLPALKITLPAAVQDAIAAYQAAMKLPIPAPPDPQATQNAVAQRAAELVREPPGKLPELAADVSQVAAARAAAEQAEHRHALAIAVKGAAAERVCQAVTGENAAQLFAAIQARHAAVVTGLASRAARLPPGIDTEGALTAGAKVREDLLHCRDRIAELRVLRVALAQVEEPGAAEFLRNDGLAVCIRWERSGELYRRYWQAGDGTTPAGPLDSEPFWLAYAALPELQWWLPTMAEAADRTAELEARFHAERVRAMAG